LRRLRIVEEDLAELRVARHLDDRADLDAGLVHAHEEVGEALVLGLRLRVRPADDEAPVGPLGARGPDLLPVDHPLVALELGARLHVREVRAGPRLGVALTPDLVAREDLRQEAGLLLGRAEVDHGRPEEPLADVADAAGTAGP